MKKIEAMMNLLMGLSMSLCMSLCGSLLSGHFEVTSWFFSFVISFVLSLGIGAAISVKRLADKACAKAGTARNSYKGRVLSALIGDIIYTPFMTVVMCFTMTTVARAEIDRQAAILEMQINDLTDQQTTLSEQSAALSAEHDGLIAQIEKLENELAELKAQPASEDTEFDIAARTVGLEEAIKDAREGMALQESGLAQQQAAIAEMQASIAGMTAARNGMLAGKPVFIREVGPSFGICMILGFLLVFCLQPLFLEISVKKYGKGVPPPEGYKF